MIKIGIVKSIADGLESGIMQVEIDGQLEPVIYTTPFYSPLMGNQQKDHAGFRAIPKEESPVVVAKSSDTEHYYFLACAPYDFQELKGIIDNGITSFHTNEPIQDQQPYEVSEKSQIQSWNNPNGAGLTFSEVDSEDFQNRYTRLMSEIGMRLVLNDTSRAITLDNGQDDGITITRDGYNIDNRANDLAPRNIRSQCWGSNIMRSTHANTEIITHGKELRILNHASESSSAPLDGHIHIESKQNDIVIKVSHPEGRNVFIDAGGSEGMVQVVAGSGGISLHTPGSVSINAGEDVSINAGGNINLQGNNVQLNPGQFSGKQEATLNKLDEA